MRRRLTESVSPFSRPRRGFWFSPEATGAHAASAADVSAGPGARADDLHRRQDLPPGAEHPQGPGDGELRGDHAGPHRGGRRSEAGHRVPDPPGREGEADGAIPGVWVRRRLEDCGTMEPRRHVAPFTCGVAPEATARWDM